MIRRRSGRWWLGLVLALAAPVSFGQVGDLQVAGFKQVNPRAQVYRQRGVVNAIYGTELARGGSPLASADDFLANWSHLWGDSIGEMRPIGDAQGPQVWGAGTDRASGQPRFYTFRYQQVFQDLPVFRSGIGFLVRNEANYPLVLTGFNLKNLANAVDVPRGGEARVTPAMEAEVAQLLESYRLPNAAREISPDALEFSDERLTLWAGVDGHPADVPEAALEFVVQFGSVQTYPDYQKRLVVASLATGAVLWSESKIHFTDIHGTVSGMATDGIRAAECDPESAFRLPYARVNVSGGSSAYANANGEFVIPHAGTTGVTVQSALIGPYFEVRDQAAGNTVPTISATVTPPGPVNFLHNATAGQQLPTANVNAYLESNVIRDFVLFYEPNFPVISTQTFFRVNTNIGSTCNAFYDGTSINFYQSGGGCSNTAFSDVVHHEYGHHLIEVTNNGQGQMGEGSGDVMGVLIQDDPILAHGFSGNCSAGIRTANNTLQYPQSGAIHTAGQLISGCVWDTRNQLIATEPSAYRDISASLFLGMLIVRGQVQPFSETIDPFITVLFLELDDDDTDIGNGTPHYQEIATGFGLHNMDAPPLNLVSFQYPSGRPELISPSGGPAFLVEVVAGAESPLPGTGVLHIDRGNGFESFPMTQLSDNLYEANFPTSPLGQELKYYVSAQSSSGSVQNNPSLAPAEYFTAISGDSQLFVFEDDFEVHRGWTVVTTAVDGAWERGIPAGGGTRGDPPTDGDGSGRCYLTDNVSGNSDVDDGLTILTSPSWDGTIAPHQETVISYYRWYSNVFGNAPEQDLFVVQLSTDGGTNWTTMETVGPSGSEVQGGWYHKSFRISDFVTPTSQMQVRFLASDLEPQSVVEAAVDGVQIRQVFENAVTTVTADSMQVVKGVRRQGDVEDTYASDDAFVRFQPGTLSKQPSIIIEFRATLPDDQPQAITAVLEARANRDEIIQRLEMWNYLTGQFEVVDSRNASNGIDQVSVVPLSGDVSRFVEGGSGNIVTRVTFNGPRLGGARWIADIDQLIWEAE